MKRVVITGIGALTAIGNSVPEYLEGLRQGRSGAGPITQFEADKFKTHFACEVKDWEPTDRVDKREARRQDRYTLMALFTADEALEMAGLLAEDGKPWLRLIPTARAASGPAVSGDCVPLKNRSRSSKEAMERPAIIHS